VPATRSHAALTGLACVLAFFAAARAIGAQPPPPPTSGAAVPRELRPADDLQSGVVSTIISGFLGGNSPMKGEISGATVVDEGPHRLVLRLATAGMEGLRVGAEVLNSQRRRVREIAAEPVDVPGTPAEVRLTILLAEGLAAGT
jgi:hypothetical protein